MAKWIKLDDLKKEFNDYFSCGAGADVWEAVDDIIDKLPTHDFEPKSGEGDKLADAAEMLWIVIANVSGGDWSKQAKEWQDVAARWRDNYLKVIGKI